MHAFSIVTLGIFVAGYSTARWDLATRLYELAVFACYHGVALRAFLGFCALSAVFLLVIWPFERIASYETDLVRLPNPASKPWRWKNIQMLTWDSTPEHLALSFRRVSSSSGAALSSGRAM